MTVGPGTVGDILEHKHARIARRQWLQKNKPSLNQLIRWENDGGCEAACPEGCWVEPDGYCEHGHPSWLRLFRMI